jgi:hypothetical protein
MHINELLEEKQTDEGIVGSAIGAGLGSMAGGPLGAAAGGALGNWAGDKLSGAWQNVKNSMNKKKAAKLRAQADQLDPQDGTATPSSSGNSSKSGSGGISTPYTNTSGAQPTASTPAAAKSIDPKVIQTSIQHLKGGDVERIRGMLKSKAGISESQLDEISIGGIARGAKNLATGAGQAVKGAYNAAAPVVKNAAQATGQAVKGAYNAAKPVVQKAAQATGQAIKAAPAAIGNAAGAVRGAVTTARGAYQQSKGGSMTAQELDHAIATMTPDQAKEMLQFFNSIHPEAAAAPASTPAVTTPTTTGTPAAEPTPQVYGSRGIAGMGESVGYSRFLKIAI